MPSYLSSVNLHSNLSNILDKYRPKTPYKPVKHRKLPIDRLGALGIPVNIEERLGTPMIIGGLAVPRNSVPFQVSLQAWDLFGGWAHFCGGSIYDSDTIITAGHCLVSVERTTAPP